MHRCRGLLVYGHAQLASAQLLSKRLEEKVSHAVTTQSVMPDQSICTASSMFA